MNLNSDVIKTGVAATAFLGLTVYMVHKNNQLQSQIDELKKETTTLANYVKILETKIGTHLNRMQGSHHNSHPNQHYTTRVPNYENDEHEPSEDSDWDDESEVEEAREKRVRIKRKPSRVNPKESTRNPRPKEPEHIRKKSQTKNKSKKTVVRRRPKPRNSSGNSQSRVEEIDDESLLNEDEENVNIERRSDEENENIQSRNFERNDEPIIEEVPVSSRRPSDRKASPARPSSNRPDSMRKYQESQSKVPKSGRKRFAPSGETPSSSEQKNEVVISKRRNDVEADIESVSGRNDSPVKTRMRRTTQMAAMLRKKREEQLKSQGITDIE